MNKTPLAEVSRHDVVFKDIGNDRYVFDGEKARANYKEFDNVLGFSNRTKKLIENWLETSKKMYEHLGINISGDLPLCPFFDDNGNVKTFSENGTKLWKINNQLEKITGMKVTSKRFRNTKSDLLMRVTEDIFIVSQGIKSSIEVVKKNYSNGIQSIHERNLNATFTAKMSIAKGKSIAEAIDNAKILTSDILSDYDYKKLRQNNKNKNLMKTPTGINCSGANSEQLVKEARRMKKLGIDFSIDTGRCTDFIHCFDCPNHKLISSENDIWLMLSFLTQIEDLK
ncbi:hypothetical protein L1D12_06950 [Vibrio parahaemolyticus]|uniref:hypothetical protein n=1 Tax=Vibrio parahaemolyticus TaxID=670 RepID=UPI001EFDB783|nr:hypothetical protein [Vibrio parahaemolyticus]MCG9635039.1 hypothetical protein [Vibrio parahaemolyticus]